MTIVVRSCHLASHTQVSTAVPQHRAASSLNSASALNHKNTSFFWDVFTHPFILFSFCEQHNETRTSMSLYNPCRLVNEPEFIPWFFSQNLLQTVRKFWTRQMKDYQMKSLSFLHKADLVIWLYFWTVIVQCWSRMHQQTCSAQSTHSVI